MNEDSLYNRLAKGILTDEEIDNLVDEIMNIPVEKNNNCLSSYGSINVDDLIDSIKELRKVPTYDELLRENKQLKENNQSMQEEMARTWAKLQQKEDIINKAKEYIINNSLYEEEYDYDYEENIYLSGIHDDDVRRILVEILDNKGE